MEVGVYEIEEPRHLPAKHSPGQVEPDEEWSVQKKNMFEHLDILTFRILQKGKDITSNIGDDWTVVYMTYGIFGERASGWYHAVCQLAKDYEFERCNERFSWAVINSKYKSLSKLAKILKFYEIDTSSNDERVDTPEELSVYLPQGVDAKFVLEYGFYEHVDGARTGYYFRTGEKSFAAKSNFVMTPLMHLMSKSDNKRIIRINNGFKTATLDLPSRNMISSDQFGASVYEAGNFLFYGSKFDLMKILNAVNDQFPPAYELKTLGWQPEGFFAFANALYKPGTPHVDRYDDVGIADVGGTNYFSPSASEIYRDQRQDDDEYENDRYLKYSETAVTFDQWADMLYQVYPDHAMIGIAFVLIGLFKDIIFKVDNNCPLLSAYGEKGSGKSKFAESITALFLHNLQPFNLNHGTDFAFFNRLSRFRNCVTWFDEFDDQAIKEDRFQSIKGAYDGAGRERGKGTNKNKTEIARINSALLLTGQYLSTRDDNAALSRCLVCAFRPNDTRTPEQIQRYETLKHAEKSGLGGLLIPLLQHRPEFEKQYLTSFATTFSELRQTITDSGNQYKERVLRNYAAALTCLRFFGEKFRLPFTFQQAGEICREEVIRLSRLMAESDSLADFWNTLVYLLDTGEISEGLHFRIISADSINLAGAQGDFVKKLPAFRKLLLLRLTTVHKLYLEAHRKQTGKTGINLQSLELYIGSAKAFLGKSRSQRFTNEQGSSTTTSCYVFDYEDLGAALEREAPEVDQPTTEVTGFLHGDIAWFSIGGKNVMKYQVMTTSTIKSGDRVVNHEVKTNMIDPEPTHEEILNLRQTVVVTGVLKQSSWKDGAGQQHTKRTMDVLSVKLADAQLTMENAGLPDAPF